MNVVRQTSIEAYRDIESNGLLSKLRFEVYKYLFNNGPCTAKQITVGLTRGSENSGSYTTRLSELKNQGVVMELGLVGCKYTNRNVILWDVTSRLPMKINKNKRSSLKEATKLLQEIRSIISPVILGPYLSKRIEDFLL